MPISNVHSMWKNGALVFYDTYRYRWVDAMGTDVTKAIFNFATLPTDDTTGDPTEFTLTPVEIGAGTSTAVLNTVVGGSLLITTAGNEDDGVNLQLKGEAFQFSASKPMYFGIKCTQSEATQKDLLVGLCITDTTLLGGMTDGVYFECLDGSTDINFVTEKNSTETTSSSALGTMDTSAHVYEFYWDGSTYVTPYIDGVAKTAHSANIPDDEAVTPSIHYLNGSAAAGTLTIDWMRAIQLG